ncbi:MAG TPA: alpha/beta family hydrolase [Candidatus Acidoferrum sp.]|nr:alpha/beta family hydrolase [Candidatus Acidoferrum sp.]
MKRDRRNLSSLDNSKIARGCPLLVSALLILFFEAHFASAGHPQQQDDALHPRENLVLENVPPIPMPLVGSAGRYTTFREAALADWHPSQREMVISTRFAEVPQLHLLASPNGARQQLTFLDEEITTARFDPEGESVIFVKNENGNGQDQLYRYELATGRIRLMTDGKSSNWLGAWSRRGGKLAYTSTKRNGEDADLWVMNPDDARTNRLLLQLVGGGWRALDWSPDDRIVLLLQEVSPGESYLWLVDVARRQQSALTPHGAGEKAWYVHARFSKDGKGIYAITDKNSHSRRLAYIDLAEKQPAYLTGETHANVDEFDLSPDGAHIAFLTAEDGLSRLRVMDTKTGKEITLPQLPAGVVQGIRWRGDGQELGFSLNTPRRTNDCYSLDLAGGKLERWTVGESTLKTDSFSEPELVHWKSSRGESLSGYLYRPPPKFWGKRPVLVMIQTEPARPRFVGRNNYFLNELGVALLYPAFENWPPRGKESSRSGGADPRDTYNHLGALFDWIATRADLDSGHVAIMGQLHGDRAALEIAKLYPERVRCAIDAPDSFTALTAAEARRLEHTEKITKPVFVVAGENDPLMPVSESQQIVSALKKQGTPVWMLMAKDEGHGFRKKWNQDFQFYAVILFLERYMLK